ncbi:MAG: hypothetical protein WAM04_15310 [Candidatus Sulfotelmatobacter sp.]
MKKAVSQLILWISVLVLALSATAQQQENHASNNNALAQLLQSKGILSASEVAMINQASSPEDANARLAKLLVEKGLISSQEFASTVAPAPAAGPAVTPVSEPSAPHRLFNAVFHPETPSQNPPQSGQTPTGTPPTPERGPNVISAVAPVRVLPIDIPKQGGLIPDIHLGSGANMKIYGFYKASAVSSTASSGGPTFGSIDWPLPLLLADTGPTSAPTLFVKARSTRIGMQTEWVPRNSGFTITGRLEADFEGDFTDVDNRNISSMRSSQFCLRLAWMRLDHTIGGLPWFALFGQDWSIMSSTLPNLFETTGLGVAMGSLYERAPQFRTGIQFHAGDLKIQPEFGIVMPIAGSSALTTDQRLREGDIAGPQSYQPGLESRVVFQFPLNKNWKGVVPAQIIFSGHHSRVNEIIPHAAQVINETSPTCTTLPCPITVFNSTTVPNVGFNVSQTVTGATNCPEASGNCTLEQFFPRGYQIGNPQNVYTAEIQLPTPWFTWVAKFYRGDDLRFFFGGQLDDVYSNLGPLVDPGSVLTGISEAGRSILFGCTGATTTGQPANTINCQGTPIQSAYLQPSGGVGGFTELSFPLSRIFHANPEGKNSGWLLHLQYGTDRAPYRDAQFGNKLGRTDLDTVSLTYRLNKWVTFVHEASYIVTFTANNHEAGGVIKPEYLPFEGLTTRQAHNWRNEFGPVFTF